MIISVVVIIVCLLVGGVLGYSNISVQDVDKGYTCNSTVSNVKKSELLKLDSSFKPKINYMNKGTEIFNEDKQIYEYVSNGEKTDKVYSLYYKKAKVKGVKASKGMVIEFDLETGCARSIHYGLTDKEFDKFVLKMGEPDYNDSDGMRWNESKYGWIVANYYDDFSNIFELFCGFQRFQLLFWRFFRLFRWGLGAVLGISTVSATFFQNFSSFWAGLGSGFRSFMDYSGIKTHNRKNDCECFYENNHLIGS